MTINRSPDKEKNSNNKSVLLIDPLNDLRWDDFVQSHPNGWITHLSDWKKILESNFPNMRGHCLALVSSTEEKIKAILPLYDIKSWLTGRRLVSVPFATLCDPLLFENEDINKLLEEAINLSKELGASHIEIRCIKFSPCISDVDCRFISSSFYKHHYLPLECEPEELKKTFHRTCVRQRISRALKSDLKLFVGKNNSDLQAFYRLFILTRKRLGLPPHPYSLIKSLWETFCPSGKLQLLLAIYHGEPIAGLILLKWKNRVSAEYAVCDDSYLSLSPNHFLFWEAIKLSFYEGYKVFDFGRTSPYNTTLMDFKNHWGTTVTDLPQYHYFESSKQEDAFICNFRRKTDECSGIYGIAKSLCKKIPSPGLEFLGNILFKHLV